MSSLEGKIMKYTIKAVHPEVRRYPTKHGEMVSYKLRFNEVDTIVELGQKPSTDAPVVGQTLEGTIDMSAAYGPKFKKDFQQTGFPNQSSSTTSGTSQATKGSFNSDPFTMYLSYAKDIALLDKLYDAKGNFNEALYSEILEAVKTGANVLYGGRPGGEPSSEANKPQDVPPKDDWADNPIDISKLDELFPGSEPVDAEEPFPSK